MSLGTSGRIDTSRGTNETAALPPDRELLPARPRTGTCRPKVSRSIQFLLDRLYSVPDCEQLSAGEDLYDALRQGGPLAEIEFLQEKGPEQLVQFLCEPTALVPPPLACTLDTLIETPETRQVLLKGHLINSLVKALGRVSLPPALNVMRCISVLIGYEPGLRVQALKQGILNALLRHLGAEASTHSASDLLYTILNFDHKTSREGLLRLQGADAALMAALDSGTGTAQLAALTGITILAEAHPMNVESLLDLGLVPTLACLLGEACPLQRPLGYAALNILLVLSRVHFARRDLLEENLPQRLAMLMRADEDWVAVVAAASIASLASEEQGREPVVKAGCIKSAVLLLGRPSEECQKAAVLVLRQVVKKAEDVAHMLSSGAAEPLVAALRFPHARGYPPLHPSPDWYATTPPELAIVRWHPHPSSWGGHLRTTQLQESVIKLIDLLVRTPEGVHHILYADGARAICDLLESGPPYVKLPILNVLHKIASAIQTGHDASWGPLVDSRLVAALVWLMCHDAQDVRRRSLEVTKLLLSRIVRLRATFVVHGAVPAVLSCIRQETRMVQEDAMEVLLLLLDEPSAIKAALAVPDAVDTIARLISPSATQRHILLAGAALGSLLTTDNTSAAKHLPMRTVSCLVRVLGGGQGHWRSKVVTALGNILKSNRKAIRVALDSGAATALVALCDTRDPDTDAAARQAIANALVDGASHVVAAFSKAGAFPTIFAGLHSSDHRVVEAGNAACFELGKSRAGSKILAQYNQPRLQRAPCWLPSTLRSFNKS